MSTDTVSKGKGKQRSPTASWENGAGALITMQPPNFPLGGRDASLQHTLLQGLSPPCFLYKKEMAARLILLCCAEAKADLEKQMQSNICYSLELVGKIRV